MKKLFLLLFTVISVSATAQSSRKQSVSYCDPSVSKLQITDLTNSPVNTDQLIIGNKVKLQFVIGNSDALNRVPKGTCEIKITVGSHFRPVKDFSIPVDFPLEDYFNWTNNLASDGSQFIITGELLKDLPPHYSGNISFTLMPYKEGGSTVTCQVLITNSNNDVTVLSDKAPMNNFVYTSYKNIKPFGVKFTQLSVIPHGCTLELNWEVFDEEKTTQTYIIETSEDGINFKAAKVLKATGSLFNTLLLEGLSSSELTVRIKAVSASGLFVYSDNVHAFKICNTGLDVWLYPNPAPTEISELILQARTGIFNGKYKIKLTDTDGKDLKIIEATYTNQLQVKINTGLMAAGVYYLSIIGEDGKTSGLKLVKQ